VRVPVLLISNYSYTPFTRSSNHQANVQQTWSKHRAIRAHVVHVYFNAFAGCLLDDCSMFAWSCKRGINLCGQVSL